MNTIRFELIRRIVATFCLTMGAAIFWAFMIGAVCRFGLGLVDQRLLQIVVGVAALCIGVALLPRVWKLMENH